MSTSKPKSTRWYYVLAILIPIFACVGTALLVYANVPELPGALEATGIHNLTQVVAPGSADIDFPKTGAYAVYYEYRSVVDGVRYEGDKYPPSIRCTLTSKATGEDVPLGPDYIEGNKYETQNRERVGVLIRSISIDQPGVYDFSCQYADGRAYPRIVLAVGPNIVWEFFNVVAKPIAAIVCGGLVFVCACGISMLIIGIVAFRRHQSKKTLAVQA
jgi:hypothetical protein